VIKIMERTFPIGCLVAAVEPTMSVTTTVNICHQKSNATKHSSPV
jgi:hypothetical protein